VRRVRAPEPADLDAVLAIAAPTATAAFDSARPLWELTLVEGLGGGRSAVVLRFHHSLTDGVGGVALGGQLFDRSRRPRRRRQHDPPRPVRTTALQRSIGTTVQLTAGATRFGLSLVRHPIATIDDGRRLARSLARALAPASPGSPELRGRGLDRRLDALEVPLERLQRAAHATGCTLNDVLLAAVGGAMATYHRRAGHPISVLQCTMPINLRTESDPRGGNRFAPARFVLPIDDPDPAVRARIAGTIARRWRSEPALAWTAHVSEILDLLPGPALTWLLGGMLKNVDVDVVNVPGLRHPAYFAGARVDRLWAFAPPTGAALSVTLVSHLDTCCLGLLSDTQAVGDHELLRACFDSSLAEVLQLGPETSIRRPA